MKKITLLALMLCISSFAFAQFPAPYCGPLNFITDIEPITLVSIAEINNATDAAVDGSPSHEDFTALTANLTLGETYEITFEGNTGGPFNNSYTVFIDFNQNDILDDAGEVFGFVDVITNSTGTDGQSYTGSIAIPADALEGDTRMRVKKIYNSTNYLDPCVEGSGYGQAEDYTVSLSAPAPVFPGPYCGPLDYETVEPISLVSIAEINNATDATVDGSPSHEDFTALTANLTLGETYEITFEGNTGGPFNNSYTVFIDFNQNDILDDAGEVFGFVDVITNSTGTDGQSYTGSIAIPADALEGDTRMRVKKVYASFSYLDPCVEGGLGYGQAEDYTVSLSAPIPLDPTELPITFENQLPAFNDFNGSFTQAIPNPDATGENTSATVAQNNVPANTGDAGVNFALDTNIDISVDKGFTMNVWSPVANMPVLLKLENASGANAEIAATTTTTSAWETITFDFSEVGQLTYEAVTIFMNFQGFDAADQIYYWDNLEQIAIEADCNPVTGITISDITETSAVVTWEAEATALDGYAVGVFLAGSDPSVDDPVYGALIPPTGILTDTATGLSSNTMYEAFVVSLCDFGGDIDIVAFSEAIPFTTLALGLADTTIEGFTFYPNPSLDVINLNATENIETVAIYNLLGQKVLDQIINATSSQLDVANLETGAYFMEVSAGAKTAWHKVIKK